MLVRVCESGLCKIYLRGHPSLSLSLSSLSLSPSFSRFCSLSMGYGERYSKAFDAYGADSMIALEVSLLAFGVGRQGNKRCHNEP